MASCDGAGPATRSGRRPSSYHRRARSRQKALNPPTVVMSEGRSSQFAVQCLVGEGFETFGYKRIDEDDWSAISPLIEVGNPTSLWRDNIGFSCLVMSKQPHKSHPQAQPERSERGARSRRKVIQGRVDLYRRGAGSLHGKGASRQRSCRTHLPTRIFPMAETRYPQTTGSYPSAEVTRGFSACRVERKELVRLNLKRVSNVDVRLGPKIPSCDERTAGF